MALAENLKYQKSLKNWTTEKLAVEANVPKDTISKILAGITRNPSMDTLQRLAAALECSIEDLVDVAPVDSTSVRELLPKKIPTDPEELANIICIALRNQRLTNERTMSELRKDRNTWRKTAIALMTCMIPCLLICMVMLVVLYWDLSHPGLGNINLNNLVH